MEEGKVSMATGEALGLRVRASVGPWDGEEPAWAGREAGRQRTILRLQPRSPGVQAGRQQEAVGDF